VRQLTPADVVAGASALLLLPLAALAVRRFGLGRVQRRLMSWTSRRRCDVTGGPALEAGRRLGWVVQTAARRGPWPANCLQRSLVLWFLLRRRGLPGELRIGVRRAPGAEMDAPLAFHAWVEQGGVVLNDRADIRERFATFDREIVPPRVVWR
jgi:hypothetical protein